MRNALNIAVPLALGIAVLALWQWATVHFRISPFVLPPPSAIGTALAENFSSLAESLGVTLAVTWIAYLLALAGGLALAIVFSQSRVAERALYPYAVILQVTPVLAIAPLILIWTGYDHVERAAVIIAMVVAFFPILSNATLGLRSVDPALSDLFALYGASRLQRLWRLQLPSALPYILAGMKISGGLALIGAVVAEFVAGSGSATGLAWRITEAGNRLEIAKMFAALALLSLAGIANFYALGFLQWLVLHRWHESALRQDD
ncbi:MAG: ABC transporter permease [Alphaproteobacteria bacterium]|nr:ABC transporter permease [Alphaproteobacteria bacterium]MBV9694861.1 ABC transporter permease [Alphaproteobacteria bacterium]